MNRPRRASVFLSAIAIFLVLCLSGCGDDDSNPAKPAGPTSVGGNVNKAPVVGATVHIHTINPDGSIGAAVAGPFTTDASGNWSGTIPAGQSGSFVMVSTGGSYTDEATGNPVTIPADRLLYGIYTSGACSVTPLSHATFLAMQDLVAGGETLSSAISKATGSSTTAFGFSFTTTVPSDVSTATAEQKEYAALLGGLSRLINANPALSAFGSTLPIDLVIALARDMADGTLDGLDASGAAILVPTDPSGTTTSPLPTLSATDLSAWLAEANTYAAMTPNLAGISFSTSTAWNPSNPGGGGGGSGSLTFGGTGRGLLPGGMTYVFTPTSSHVVSGTQLVWDDDVNHVQVLIVPADQGTYPGKVQTVYVVYSGVTPSAVWSASSSAGLAGVDLLANDTAFSGVTVTEMQPGTTSTLTLTGTLASPTPSGNLGSVDYTVTTPASSGTVMPTATYIDAGTWVWMDQANNIEIRVVPANQSLYPNAVETVYFIITGTPAWLAHGVSGVADVTISGSTTVFNNTALADLATGTNIVRLTGTLTNPMTP